jgi:O-antigen/teichoic acid export membrane protein
MTEAAAPSADSVARGGAWRLAASLVPQVYVFAISVVAARVLGPDGMGRQSYIAFVAATTTLLLTGGLAASLMRNVAELVGKRDHEQISALVRWTARRQGVAALLAAALVMAAGVVQGGDLRTAWAFAAAGAAIGVVHSVPNAVLVGFQRWRQHSVRALVTGAAGAAATIAVLLLGGGIVGMFAVEAVVTAGGLVLMATLAARLVPGWRRAPQPDADLQRRTRSYARGALLQLVLHVIVWRRTELFVLERTSTPAALAHYSIAFSMLAVLSRVPISLTATLSPAFATLKGAGQHERIASGFARAVRLLLLASLPITAAVLAAGPRLLTGVYGGEYRPAGTALVIMACAFPLVALHHIGVSLLQGLGTVRPLVAGGAAATVVDIALAAALIPDHGATGAAIANACAQVTAAALTFFFARRAVGRVHVDGRALAGLVAASAFGGFAAWCALRAVDGAGGLAVAAVAGATALAVTARIVGVVARGDAEWLQDAVRGPAGRVVAGVARQFSS